MSTTKSNIIALRKKGLTLIANEDTRHIYSGSVRGHFLGWPTITIFVTKTITKWIYEALVILRNFSLLSSRWNNCFFFFFKYENYRETSKNSKLCWTARLSDPVANAITLRKERTLRTRYKLLSEVRYFVYLARNVRFKKVLCQEWPPDFWSKWIVLV